MVKKMEKWIDDSSSIIAFILNRHIFELEKSKYSRGVR